MDYQTRLAIGFNRFNNTLNLAVGRFLIGLSIVFLFFGRSAEAASRKTTRPPTSRDCSPEFAMIARAEALELRQQAERNKSEAARIFAMAADVEPIWSQLDEIGHPFSGFIRSLLPPTSDPQTAERGFVMFQQNLQARIDQAFREKKIDPSNGYKVIRVFKDEKTNQTILVRPGDAVSSSAKETGLISTMDFYKLKADGYFIMGAPDTLLGSPIPFHDAGHLRPFIVDPDLLMADREMAREIVKLGKSGFTSKMDDLIFVMSENLTTVRKGAEPNVQALLKKAGFTMPATGFVTKTQIESSLKKLSNSQILDLYQQIRKDHFKIVEPVGGVRNDMIFQMSGRASVLGQNRQPSGIHRLGGSGTTHGLDGILTMNLYLSPERLLQVLTNGGQPAEAAVLRDTLADFLTTAANGTRASAADLFRDITRQKFTPQPGSLYHRYFCESGAYSGIKALCPP